MDSLGSMVMPEAFLIAKTFDQQLRALANSVSMQNDVHIHAQTHTQCNNSLYFNLLHKYQYIHAQYQRCNTWDFSTKQNYIPYSF